MRKTLVKDCLFPALIGLAVGAAAAAAILLLGALAAVKLQLSLTGYGPLSWLPVICGAISAGMAGAGAAKEGKLLSGMLAALLLWLVLLMLLESYQPAELLRGGVMLLGGALGAAAFRRKRRKFKPGKPAGAGRTQRIHPRRSF
jgi:hypothetical protein